MSFKIISTQSFLKDVKRLSKRYPSLKEDLRNLGVDLLSNHRAGTPIGRNCYKIRLQITSKGKGKSGGARVISHLIVNVENEIL